MRWAGHAAHMVERTDPYKRLVRKPERRKPLGRPNDKWEDNTKMDFLEVRWGKGSGLSIANLLTR
jgi:hypothetical protein